MRIIRAVRKAGVFRIRVHLDETQPAESDNVLELEWDKNISISTIRKETARLSALELAKQDETVVASLQGFVLVPD